MLATLIAAIVSGETLSTLSRAKQTAMSYALVALCGLMAALFLLLGLYLSAARELGPIWAAFIFAVIFAAAAVLVQAVSRSRARRRDRIAAQRRNSELMTMGLLSAAAGAPSLISGRKMKAAAAAAAVPLLLTVAYLGYRRLSRPDPDQE